MDTLIIGEGPLTINKVAKVVERSASFATLQTRWRSFAIYIGVSDAELPGLEGRMNLGSLTLRDVPREILNIWKADKGTNATMTKLCKALDQCHLSDISDALKGKFCPVVQPEKQLEFILDEKIYTVDQLFENNVPDEISQIIRSTCQTHTAMQPIPIIREEVCPLEIPVYYIPRTLSDRKELDEQIFRADATKEHIFLVKGGGKPELARASGFKPIERSGSQLREVTVRHILLEHDNDFHTICKKTSKPVHMIEFKDNSFLHFKSSAGMDEIQGFIKEDGVTFGEDDAVKMINELQPPFVLSIADSPGMGKTLLLAKLSALIRKSNPNAIILFIVLHELAQTLSYPASNRTALEAISSYVTSSQLSELVFQEILKNNKYQFFLFFDGYDEVMPDKIDSVDLLIQDLVLSPNIKIITTTRFHLKPRLENLSQTLSYQILPFSESNQIEFLTKYWNNAYRAENNEKLQAFAKKCLVTLEFNMKDKEKNIAGIPLQLFLLAEVYGEQAKRAAELETLPEDVVTVDSLFEMYKSLIKLKFKRVGNSEELLQKYFHAHVHGAITLLFPDWLERFYSLLGPLEEVEESMMYSIGIIEKSPSSKTSKFLHRTFAEYFLAQFIVGNLFNGTNCLQFLYKEIFGSSGVTSQRRDGMPILYQMRYPTIAYFVEMHLRDRATKGFASLDKADLTSIIDEDVCIAANVCVCHDLENCFDLTHNILAEIDIKNNLKLMKYFKHLPHLVVEKTENISLLQKVLNFTKEKFQVNFDWHVYDHIRDLGIANFTPLHHAVYQGKYNMVTYLLEKYGTNVGSINHLMHCCLHQSASNRDSIVEDKLSIIESITEITSKEIRRDLDGREPILQFDAHVRLIKHLVQLDVNINTNNGIDGTILHTGGDKSTYADLVRWAFDNGFNLINNKDGRERTPLMLAIARFQLLEDDVLQMFHDAKADFNAQDDHGDSVLFYAIEWTRNAEFVGKILDFGASLAHLSKDGQNAAHKIIDYNADDPIRALELLELILSRGFTGFYQICKHRKTPFTEAIRKGIMNDEVLKHLVAAGADEDGNSVLFHSIDHRLQVDIIQRILKLGGNVNLRNKEGENAAHLVIRSNGDNQIRALEILKLLQSKGFKGLHQKDHNGTTPVEIVIRHESVNDGILKHFVDSEAGTDENGVSILFHAIWFRQTVAVIQKILEFGGNVNYRNKLGENAAHLVIRSNVDDHMRALELLTLLQSRGFKGLFQKDKLGYTPFKCAIILEDLNDEMIKYFGKAETDEDGNSILFQALQCATKDVEMIKKLLDFGENVNHRNKDKQNAAHLVIQFNGDDHMRALELLALLQSRGFKGLFQKNKLGYTPFKYAIILKRMNDEMIKYFKKAGADEDGNSILFQALQCATINVEMIKKLLDFGENVNHRNNAGENAAHIVIQYGNSDLALVHLKLLESNGFMGFNQKNGAGRTPLEVAKRYMNNDELIKYLKDKSSFCQTQ